MVVIYNQIIYTVLRYYKRWCFEWLELRVCFLLWFASKKLHCASELNALPQKQQRVNRASKSLNATRFTFALTVKQRQLHVERSKQIHRSALKSTSLMLTLKCGNSHRRANAFSNRYLNTNCGASHVHRRWILTGVCSLSSTKNCSYFWRPIERTSTCVASGSSLLRKLWARDGGKSELWQSLRLRLLSASASGPFLADERAL